MFKKRQLRDNARPLFVLFVRDSHCAPSLAHIT